MPAPKSITPDSWNQIVAVFLKHDGRILASAQELGWPVARAERVFKRGYPSIGYPPVKTLLSRDRLSEQEIRARRAELESLQAGEAGSTLVRPAAPSEAGSRQRSAPQAHEEEPQRAQVLSAPEQRRMTELLRRESEREKARQDALKSRAEEATLVGLARRNAIALNAVTAQVLRGATELAGTIQRELEELARNSSGLTTGQKLQLVRQAAQIARFNAESAALAVKSERLVMGHTPEDAEQESSGSLEESASWIEASVRAVERARARGLLVLPEQAGSTLEQPMSAPQAREDSDRVTPGIHAELPDPANVGDAGRADLPTAGDEQAARRKPPTKHARGLLRLADRVRGATS